jgi:hypothetical protein
LPLAELNLDETCIPNVLENFDEIPLLMSLRRLAEMKLRQSNFDYSNAKEI